MDLYWLDCFGGIRVLDSIVDTYRYSPHWHEEYVIAIYRDAQNNFSVDAIMGLRKQMIY